MQYQLIRSKRRTIAISFDRDGNLIVKAPLWVSLCDIESFLLQKTDWITQTGERLKQSRQEEKSKRLPLENGDIVWYLGEKRILSIMREERKTGRIKCAMDRIIMWIPYDAGYEFKLALLEKWYRKEAGILLNEKAEEFADLLHVTYQTIHIKDQKSRWGSCSGRGNLNFNWRIIMAPEPVCDYVVIHELCHLVHMNHSQEFWKLVESICPNYQQYKKWLKNNADTLYFQKTNIM